MNIFDSLRVAENLGRGIFRCEFSIFTLTKRWLIFWKISLEIDKHNKEARIKFGSILSIKQNSATCKFGIRNGKLHLGERVK